MIYQSTMEIDNLSQTEPSWYSIVFKIGEKILGQFVIAT